MLNIVFFIS
ncbi:hypothetical protein VTH06DRAFT_4574 [Thermothelomyces fergusii]